MTWMYRRGWNRGRRYCTKNTLDVYPSLQKRLNIKAKRTREKYGYVGSRAVVWVCPKWLLMSKAFILWDYRVSLSRSSIFSGSIWIFDGFPVTALATGPPSKGACRLNRVVKPWQHRNCLKCDRYFSYYFFFVVLFLITFTCFFVVTFRIPVYLHVCVSFTLNSQMSLLTDCTLSYVLY